MKTTDPQRARTFSLVLIVTGALLAVFALIAIIGVWSISSVLTNSVLPLLSRTEQAVGRLDDSVQRLDNRLAAAQDRILEIENRVNAAGLTLEQANLLQLALDRLIGEELAPILEEVRNIINGVVQIADGIEDTLAAVNSIPFVNVQVPGAQAYHDLRDQISTLITTVQDLRTELQNRKIATVQELVAFVTGYTGRAKDIISRARAPMGAAQLQTANLRARLAQLSVDLPGQITWSAIGLTVVFLAVMVTQLFLIGAGWSLRTGRPFLGVRLSSAGSSV